uniref:Uncharacterized protein n=1 Tax=Magallana gigas TaxID=29159 RepID=A0A8W8K4V4_MAGGI
MVASIRLSAENIQLPRSKRIWDMPSSKDTSSSMKLRKAINRESGSLVWETVDDDTVQMLSSTCISRNINFTGAKRSKFHSHRTKADQLANKGTPALINVDDNTKTCRKKLAYFKRNGSFPLEKALEFD